jgi:hypothetical protein
MDPQSPPPPPYAPPPGQQPEQPPQWGTGAPPPQVPYTPMPQQQPPAKRSSGGIVRSIVGTLIVIALIVGAYLLYRAVTNTAAVNEIAVGDCVDLPSNDSSISELQKQPCTSPHDAEVFLNITDPAAKGAAYPITLHFDNLASEQCVPAATAYLGTDFELQEALTIGYLYPTSSSWDESNDRGITCYLKNDNDTKLTVPLKNSGAQPS